MKNKRLRRSTPKASTPAPRMQENVNNIADNFTRVEERVWRRRARKIEKEHQLVHRLKSREFVEQVVHYLLILLLVAAIVLVEGCGPLYLRS